MIYIFSEAIRTGKTTFLMEQFKSHKNAGGFLSPDINENRFFFNLKENKYVPFQAAEEGIDTITVGKFIFYSSSFDKMTQVVKSQVSNKNIAFILIDEIGKLELKNKGFSKLLSFLLQLDWDTKNLILVIRESLRKEIIESFKIIDYKLITRQDLKTMAKH